MHVVCYGFGQAGFTGLIDDYYAILKVVLFYYCVFYYNFFHLRPSDVQLKGIWIIIYCFNEFNRCINHLNCCINYTFHYINDHDNNQYMNSPIIGWTVKNPWCNEQISSGNEHFPLSVLELKQYTLGDGVYKSDYLNGFFYQYFKPLFFKK